ncbi:MAG: hypothetical protein PHE43_00270 [Candidatus Nanoarchaeia archaeon]|nr:hypothetical protein [Candidatus Nanoarchaeia archaeon]
MAENNSDFVENVKMSFKMAKEDISALEIEINKLKQIISEQNNKIIELMKKIEESRIRADLEGFSGSSKSGSIGNKGVESLTHSLTHSENIPKTSFLAFNSEVNKIFTNFTQQEFKVFLTIYQIEEEKKQVSYLDVANHLGMSDSGVRSYISRLISKGAPIIKTKINTKLSLLHILPEFRQLNLKNKLLDLYYHRDPLQKRLSDHL